MVPKKGRFGEAGDRGDEGDEPLMLDLEDEGRMDKGTGMRWAGGGKG